MHGRPIKTQVPRKNTLEHIARFCQLNAKRAHVNVLDNGRLHPRRILGNALQHGLEPMGRTLAMRIQKG